jgi:hypothetical protein
MEKEIMERRAVDNEYLHKDFHGALSAGIEYLHERFGQEAVREYLHGFARTYYAPLIEKIEQSGLTAIRDHIKRVYEIEGGKVEMTLTDNELNLRVPACPAVSHMRQNGYRVARLFRETTEAVNNALCEGTPCSFELIDYDEQTGRSAQRFCRRNP